MPGDKALVSDYGTWESYLWPGSQVLKNLAGIKNFQALSQFEHDASSVRAASLHMDAASQTFDLRHLQTVHRHLFQDVYAWAGELRTVNISKGGSQFARVERIRSYAALLSSRLAAENHLRELPKEQFVERLVHHYSEWNALHPFREGNGRATRVFIGQLCQQAGYEMDLTRLGDTSSERWSQAAAASFNGRMAPMQVVFTQAIRPLVAHAFEHFDERQALDRHPELLPVFQKLGALEEVLRQKYGVDEKRLQEALRNVRQVVLEGLDNGKRIDAGSLPVPAAQPTQRPSNMPEPISAATPTTQQTSNPAPAARPKVPRR